MARLGKETLFKEGRISDLKCLRLFMEYGMGDGVQKIGKWFLKSMARLWLRKVGSEGSTQEIITEQWKLPLTSFAAGG